MAIGRYRRRNCLPGPCPPRRLFLLPSGQRPRPGIPRGDLRIPTAWGRETMTERPTGISTPIAEPITGREELGDLSRPEQALAQFYRGLNGRDLALLAENWEPSDDAVMDNPLGGIS